MNEKLQGIVEKCMESELDLRALDGTIATLFDLFHVDNIISAKLAYNSILLCKGFNLDDNLIGDIVTMGSLYEIEQAVRSIIPSDIYEFYNELFLVEFASSMAPAVRELENALESTKDLLEEFEENNNKLKDTLS